MKEARPDGRFVDLERRCDLLTREPLDLVQDENDSLLRTNFVERTPDPLELLLLREARFCARNQLFVRIETSGRTAVSLPLYGNQADLGGSGAPFTRVSRDGMCQALPWASIATYAARRRGAEPL